MAIANMADDAFGSNPPCRAEAGCYWMVAWMVKTDVPEPPI